MTRAYLSKGASRVTAPQGTLGFHDIKIRKEILKEHLVFTFNKNQSKCSSRSLKKKVFEDANEIFVLIDKPAVFKEKESEVVIIISSLVSSEFIQSVNSSEDLQEIDQETIGWKDDNSSLVSSEVFPSLDKLPEMAWRVKRHDMTGL